MVLTIVLLTATLAAQEHEHPASPRQKLGTVRFKTSCNASAQPDFIRGMALLRICSKASGRSIREHV
jgi:hypothetical protein